MKLYRIYTENKNKAEIIDILKVLDGFTILEATGYWLGSQPYFLVEASLVIERLGYDDKELINRIAEEIKSLNQQESVIVTCQDVEAEFV